LEPAIAVARDGFEVYGQLAEALDDRKDILARFPESTAIFFKEGQPLKKGETLIQRELAATLTRVANDGGDDFIAGETARRMVAAVKKHGGLMDATDLLKYKMLERQPLTTSFAGRTILSMPPPSSGGIAAIEILNILDRDRNAIAKAGFASFYHWHMLAEAMRRAFADRANFLGDPDFIKIPMERLTGLEHAAKWRAGINSKKASVSLDLPLDPAAPQRESGSTTHISVVDEDGNAVATTQTINYSFGSCLVAAGTGIVLNDEMDDFSRGGSQPNAYGLIGNAANAIAPRKTPLSSMTPTIVLNGSKQVEIVAGSPGGPRIISATLQTLFNHMVFDMTPAESVHAPRIHHQWIPDKLFVEIAQAPQSTIAQLKSAGHVVENIKMVGDVQAVFSSSDPAARTRKLTGVSDTRSEGMPRGH
jgi:gamma-glutamyltranspeptidase/glutathione hydrolase